MPRATGFEAKAIGESATGERNRRPRHRDRREQQRDRDVRDREAAPVLPTAPTPPQPVRTASPTTIPRARMGGSGPVLLLSGSGGQKMTGRRKITKLSVEYNLTEHCNLNCHLCNHASPLLPKKFASVKDFANDLEALSRVFHSKEIRIIGGEPTLHPDLLDFLLEARRIKVADMTVLVTNGVLLHKMPKELWPLIDKLWISIYPGVDIRMSGEECEKICKDNNVELYVLPQGKFFKTLINNKIEDDALVDAIFKECRNANEWSCHTVYEGRVYRCSIAPFVTPRLALRGCHFDSRHVDSVALHNNPNLFEELDACLNGKRPLAACSYCLGTSGPMVDHRQLNRQERAARLEEDDSAVIGEVRLKMLQAAGRVRPTQWQYRWETRYHLPLGEWK